MLVYPLKMVIFHNDVHSPVVVVLVFDTWPRNCNLPSVKNMDVALVLQVQRARDWKSWRTLKGFGTWTWVLQVSDRLGGQNLPVHIFDGEQRLKDTAGVTWILENLVKMGLACFKCSSKFAVEQLLKAPLERESFLQEHQQTESNYMDITMTPKLWEQGDCTLDCFWYETVCLWGFIHWPYPCISENQHGTAKNLWLEIVGRFSAHLYGMTNEIQWNSHSYLYGMTRNWYNWSINVYNVHHVPNETM